MARPLLFNKLQLPYLRSLFCLCSRFFPQCWLWARIPSGLRATLP